MTAMRVLSAAVFLGLAGTFAAAADGPPAIEGKWVLATGVKAGETMEKAAGTLTATDGKMVLTNESETFEFTYKLDGKAAPAAIDMEIVAPEAFKGATAKGIIAVDGDTLKLAYDPQGGDRPTKFESGKDSGVFYFTLTKAK